MKAEGEELYEVELLRNKHTEDTLVKLNQVKNLIASQLLIPRAQITKNVFDEIYESMVLRDKSTGSIVGAATFKVNSEERFCNLEYFAISKEEVRKGLGKTMLCCLKKEMQSRRVSIILTQADEFSIQFYMKNGFIKLSKKETSAWMGFLTEYSNTSLIVYTVKEGINLQKAD